MSPSAVTRSTSLLVLGVAVFLVGGLAGCAGEPAPSFPVASESVGADAGAEPVFASDEEALAAALAVYDGYLAVDREISAASGDRPERVREFVTESYAKSAIAQYAAFSNTGGRIEGAITYDGARLVQWGADAQGAVEVQVYLCSDISDARALNAAGQDVTPTGRTERLPLSLLFTTSENDSLRLESSELWSGSSTC